MDTGYSERVSAVPGWILQVSGSALGSGCRIHVCAEADLKGGSTCGCAAETLCSGDESARYGHVHGYDDIPQRAVAI